MVEEGTLGLVRPEAVSGQLSKMGEDPSKDELQHRMEAARESISHTVEELKETMVNQYESVKETVSKTLDWHEQVTRRPVAWSAGAVGVGFVVGYGVAAVVKGPGKVSVQGYRDVSARPARVKLLSADLPSTTITPSQGTAESGAGLVERIKDTPAYDRLTQEAGVLGNRLVDELSKKAQEVVLPAALALIGKWLEGVLPAKVSEPGKTSRSS